MQILRIVDTTSPLYHTKIVFNQSVNPLSLLAWRNLLMTPRMLVKRFYQSDRGGQKWPYFNKRFRFRKKCWISKNKNQTKSIFKEKLQWNTASKNIRFNFWRYLISLGNLASQIGSLKTIQIPTTNSDFG